MGIPGGIEDHPDLKDEAWIRAANRRAKREIRKQRRSARMRTHGGKTVSAISLVVIAATLFGFYQAGTFGDLKIPDVVAPYKGVNKEVPFASTPAEQWADGEKGIVAPDQDPEYAPLYEAARKALIAAHLDPKMTVEHKPDAFFAMLSQPTMEALEKDLDSVVVTRIKPGTTLLPNGIKVDGRMWPGRDEHGQPVVHTSYRFAYAFDPGDRTLLEQYEIVAMMRVDTDFQQDAEGLWLPEVEGYWYSMACDAADQGYLAPQFTEKQPADPSKTDSKAPEEWFASNAPIPTEDGCN